LLGLPLFTDVQVIGSTNEGRSVIVDIRHPEKKYIHEKIYIRFIKVCIILTVIPLTVVSDSVADVVMSSM
jgi:hypothetical protein